MIPWRVTMMGKSAMPHPSAEEWPQLDFHGQSQEPAGRYSKKEQRDILQKLSKGKLLQTQRHGEMPMSLTELKLKASANYCQVRDRASYTL